MVILYISEEYGYRTWYAVLTPQRWEELKTEWQTLKALNCLVPVPFLIPEAKSFPLWPEHEKYADLDVLRAEDVQIMRAHIHEADDSGLGGVEYTIPPQPDDDSDGFEFKGRVYTTEDVKQLHEEYAQRYNSDWDVRLKEHPELATIDIGPPAIWFGPPDSEEFKPAWWRNADAS